MPAAANQEFARLTRKNQPTGTHNEEWSSLASFVSGANPTGESWPFVKLVSGATANKWFRRLPVHDAAVEDPRFARLTARGADALFGAALRVAFTFASRRAAISASIAGNRAPAVDR